MCQIVTRSKISLCVVESANRQRITKPNSIPFTVCRFVRLVCSALLSAEFSRIASCPPILMCFSPFVLFFSTVCEDKTCHWLVTCLRRSRFFFFSSRPKYAVSQVLVREPLLFHILNAKSCHKTALLHKLISRVLLSGARHLLPCNFNNLFFLVSKQPISRSGFRFYFNPIGYNKTIEWPYTFYLTVRNREIKT